MSELMENELRERLEALDGARRYAKLERALAGIGVTLLISLIYWAGSELVAINRGQNIIAADVRVLSKTLDGAVALNQVSVQALDERVKALETENTRIRQHIENLLTRIRADGSRHFEQ